MCSLGSNQQYGRISSDDGLQAIIWTNNGMFYWRIFGSLAPNALTMLEYGVL